MGTELLQVPCSPVPSPFAKRWARMFLLMGIETSHPMAVEQRPLYHTPRPVLRVGTGAVLGILAGNQES